jgi:hypothetical protein
LWSASQGGWALKNIDGPRSWLAYKPLRKSQQALGALVRSLETSGLLEKCRAELEIIQDRINVAAAERPSEGEA